MTSHCDLMQYLTGIQRWAHVHGYSDGEVRTDLYSAKCGNGRTGYRFEYLAGVFVLLTGERLEG